MLINEILGKTGKSYASAIKTRLIVSLVLIVLGFVTFAIALLFANRLPSDFLRGLYTGTGTGLAAGGAGILISNLRLIRNKEKMKERETAERDERNSFLMMKSSGSAFFFGVLSLYIAALIAGLYEQTILIVMLVCGAGFLALWGLMYLIYSRKY